jgi:hypothetical protein
VSGQQLWGVSFFQICVLRPEFSNQHLLFVILSQPARVDASALHQTSISILRVVMKLRL